MKKIPARRILDFAPKDFEDKLKSTIRLVYDDGIVVSHTPHELIVNRYIYSLLEIVPALGIQSKYSIHNYYVAGQYVANTINLALEAILEDIVDIYVPRTGGRECLEPVYEKMYLILEDIYNNVVCEHLEYVASLNIRDFLDIQLKPELLAAINEVRVAKDLNSVQNTYTVLDKVIRESTDLRDNPIAKGYISGTISSNQVKQLLASRGFVTEVDSTIFKYPIASSFVLGMDSIYDMAIESRSGAKALYLANRAIPISEYFAREIQLVAMFVEALVDGDCGNQDYIEWVVAESDFKNILGAHYFLDGKEYVISKDSREIIGTTIKMRNAIRCKLNNKKHICTACFGKLSNNIPVHANIGHLAVTDITGKITQNILSTKHLTNSAASDTIVLSGGAKDYFIIKNKNTYVFRANTINKRKKSYALHITQQEGFGLADIHKTEDVYKLNLARVSKIAALNLVITDADGVYEEIPLIIKQGSRYGNLTYDFLDYIKTRGHTLDAADRYIINLDGWSVTTPVISLPQVEFNYIDLAKAVKDEFKSMKANIGTPEAFLHKIFNLINSKLDINVALLEVIVYAFTVANPNEGRYGLGRASDDAEPTKIVNIMKNRSIGGSYAWESVGKTLLSPMCYYGVNNVDHPLDVLLMPNQVMMDYHNKL